MSQPLSPRPGVRVPVTEASILTWDDLDAVNAFLAEFAPGWSPELNQTGPNEATIVVMPEGANDLLGPCFVLHRLNGRVRLDQFRWDEYRKLGAFASLREALAAMRERLRPLLPSSAIGH